MKDWRSKPRNGKASFIKHLNYIQEHLAAGETQTSIRTHLTKEFDLCISASQFSRYVKKFDLAPSKDVSIAAFKNADRELDLNKSLPKKKPDKPVSSSRGIDFKKIREDAIASTILRPVNGVANS